MNNSMLSDRIEKFILEMLGKQSTDEILLKRKDVADLFVRIPVESRAKAPDEIHSEQAMTSLFEHSLLLFGDTTALMLVREKHLELDKLWEYHANLE